MRVKIKNLKNGRMFEGIFDTKEECEQWVAKHKQKGADEKIVFSPQKLDGAEVLGEEAGPMGKTYKLKIPAEYIVEYDKYDENETKAAWAKLNAKRKEVLAKTDWTQLADVSLATDERRMWREYRKYVREIKAQYNDESIHRWNIKTFEEWKNWKHYHK